MALTKIKADGLTADLIDETKLADDSIDSEHYNDGSIDTAHLAADAVTGAKIADDAVGAEHIETLDGNVQFADSAELRLGASSDLQLYHDATNSHIKNDTNALIIRSDALRCNNNGNSETMIKADADGAVELYHDNSKKIETRSDGMIVWGASGGHAQFRLAANEGAGGGDYWRLESNTSTSKFNLATFASSAWVDKFTVDTSGNVSIIGGNLVMSTSGKGIDFSATSDAGLTGASMDNELFADYEEGSWTPKIKKYVSGSWIDATMTTAGSLSDCYYVKIGDIVHFHIGWSGFEVSDSNYSVIGGLPFASAGRGSCVVGYTTAFNSHQNQGGHISAGGDTNIQFYHTGNNWNAWNNNTSSLYIYADGWYKAA